MVGSETVNKINDVKFKERHSASKFCPMNVNNVEVAFGYLQKIYIDIFQFSHFEKLIAGLNCGIYESQYIPLLK